MNTYLIPEKIDRFLKTYMYCIVVKKLHPAVKPGLDDHREVSNGESGYLYN